MTLRAGQRRDSKYRAHILVGVIITLRSVFIVCYLSIHVNNDAM